jgi:hypothetical protein
MQTDHLFVIDSDSSGHRLFLDGDEIGAFRTLNVAEAKAAAIARGLFPVATLDFALDFKWTLSDVEIRTASFTYPREAASTVKGGS